MRLIQLMTLVLISFFAMSSFAEPVGIDLTPKQIKELKKYTSRMPLVYPMTEGPKNPNYQFNKETLYDMRNFKILQKVPGGYLISTESVTWSSGNSMDFGVAFFKTNKKLPSEAVMNGVVVYTGSFKYKALNGYDKSVPQLVIPANLPLFAFLPSVDRFEPVKF